jgi:predicted membrane protein
MINTDSIKVLNALNPNIELSYIYLNFNDVASGCITLFAIMVNNNWQYLVFMYSYQLDKGSHMNSICSILFFVSFYIICFYAVLNILIAFIIDIYATIDEKERLKAKEERKKLREAREEI